MAPATSTTRIPPPAGRAVAGEGVLSGDSVCVIRVLIPVDDRKVSCGNAGVVGVLGGVGGVVEKSILTVWVGLHICGFTDAVQPVFPAAWLFPGVAVLVAR